jgi:hypothetical protein
MSLTISAPLYDRKVLLAVHAAHNSVYIDFCVKFTQDNLRGKGLQDAQIAGTMQQNAVSIWF